MLILNPFTTCYSEEKVSRALAILKMAIFQKFGNKGSCFVSLENQQVVLQTLCAGKPLHSGERVKTCCFSIATCVWTFIYSLRDNGKNLEKYVIVLKQLCYLKLSNSISKLACTCNPLKIAVLEFFLLDDTSLFFCRIWMQMWKCVLWAS